MLPAKFDVNPFNEAVEEEPSTALARATPGGWPDCQYCHNARGFEDHLPGPMHFNKIWRRIGEAPYIRSCFGRPGTCLTSDDSFTSTTSAGPSGGALDSHWGGP